MLGLTLWSLNFFQRNQDLLGAMAFVLSLGFKQMALYYSPAMCVFSRLFLSRITADTPDMQIRLFTGEMLIHWRQRRVSA